MSTRYLDNKPLYNSKIEVINDRANNNNNRTNNIRKQYNESERTKCNSNRTKYNKRLENKALLCCFIQLLQKDATNININITELYLIQMKQFK